MNGVIPDKIKIYRTTTTECGCPAYRYSLNRKTGCKHIRALLLALEMVKAGGYTVGLNIKVKGHSNE